MIEAGTVLQNRYRVQRQIGQGGMGAVYIATDERFGSVVAIKETLVLEENYRKAIEREARLLNSLKHPALPRVSDHFDDDDGQFIVMEYIAGEDLSEMMERDGGNAFPVATVLDWADQLLDALDFLHTQEIPVIHRDIKPQNLKLTPRGQIILLDFGLAKGNPTDVSHQTAAKSIFGYSRNYASLEQIQGTGTDPRSDLYSLAATVYHLLTGTAPEDALTRAMHVLNGQPDTLSPAHLVHEQVPRGVAAVLQQAMNLNANHRPETAAEMRRMLREPEKYAQLVPEKSDIHAKTSAGVSVLTDVYARDTKILPLGDENQTDVKTKILPENGGANATAIDNGGRLSRENSERKTLNFSAPAAAPIEKSGNRGLVVAAAIAGLLLVGVGFAGIFYTNPEMFGGSRAAENSKPGTANSSAANNQSSETVSGEPKTETANAQPANVSVADTTAIPAPPAPPAPENLPTEAKSGTATSASRSDTAKASENERKTPQSERILTPEELAEEDFNVDPKDVRIKDGKVYMGNIVISDEGIRTPRGLFKNGSTPGNIDIPAGLTPEQKEKLKAVRKQQMQVEREKQRIEMQKQRQQRRQPQTPNPPTPPDSQEN